jgi:hypothetical protein
LNYFEKAIWVEHPWLCVVNPEGRSLEAIVTKDWGKLAECPTNKVLVSLRDVSQWHISPFKRETAEFVKDLEFAPATIKLWRPVTYGIRFCLGTEGAGVPFETASIGRFVLNLTAMNREDVKNRIRKKGANTPL